MSDLFDKLTKKQKAVYEFIREKIRSRGYGPTVREIGDNFGIASPNGVMCHLKALEKKGFIKREPNMSRAIQLTAEPLDDSGLPLTGQISAGGLHEAIEQQEWVDFNSMFNKKNMFALQVHGDSMINAHIDEGDYVVVKKARSAKDGDIVIAQTDEGEATLKYWKPGKSGVKLVPGNPKYKTITSKDAKVLGVVVGVVRKM